jgi:hypothetical protein
MMTTKQPTPTFPASWVLAPYKPTPHLLQLERRNQRNGKATTSEYLPVKERLVWFVSEQRQLIAAGLATTTYCIRPHLVEHDAVNGHATFECTIRDVLGNEATDYGSESRVDWGDYLEKASTKATGRALAALGYGTSFATELDEEERIVDSPVMRKPAPVQSVARPEGQSEASEEGETPANEQQLQSIRKLCAALGREEPAPEVLTFASASSLIKQLSKEYNTQRRAG